ncbi:AI-2E family transporter [Mucilaginibacter limnophilus]|uniref:AI-2E family transporter n=1 Tax=Mucilaginibacter limnophilus TaxID=1932778 RepID=A0A437MLE3_9SPHI|nr:AI-2E family transporter [Mucilaginibacter limnophilus]RVT98435.1 AI-2E family transporter [Mucilaginibacter limnophilus]
MKDTEKDGGNDPALLAFGKKLGLTALLVVVLLLVRATFNVFMMVLAASLIALYFHGLADIVQRRTNIGRRWSMTISVAGSFLLLLILLFLIGSKVQSQVEELSSRFPSMVEEAKGRLNESAAGRKVLEQFSGDNAKKVAGTAQQFFSSTFGVLGDLYVILFLGIFFTASPGIYKKGIIALVPAKGEAAAEDILDKLGTKLKNWLKGKIFAMAVVAVLTAVSLAIIGVPMIFALALIAGALNFIPNFGPIMAMVPAVLIGLSQGTDTALLIAGIYVLIQVIESNFITPLVQNKLVSIPPAMIIAGQLIVGSLTGYLGIILATPLVLIVMVLVQELYVKKKRRAE